jgi:predicted nucleic-acid-binding protein
MIGLDTNVLARYFVEEAEADAATQRQREAARDLIESGQELFLPKTVALELEWVLRGYYGFGVEQVLQVLDQLLHHTCLEVEDRPALEQAVAGVRAGLDFADALPSRHLPQLRHDCLLRRSGFCQAHPPAQPAAACGGAVAGALSNAWSMRCPPCGEQLLQVLGDLRVAKAG